MDPHAHQTISESFNGIYFHPLTLGAAAGLLVLLLLLLVSALMSGSEIALFSLTPSELKRIKENKNGKNPIVLRLLEMPEDLLATILIVNNFVNISFVIISTFITNSLVDFSTSHLLGFIFQVVIITFLILLFGEILPKIYASHHALKFSYSMVQPLLFLCSAFKPLTFLLTRSSNIFSNRVPNRRKNISMHDLSHALELTTSSIHEERGILEGIVKFANIDVRDIMMPRMDLVAADISWSFSRLIALINESGYSRVPVYSGTPDKIKGILYIKDLLPHLHKNDAFKWQSLIRPPYFVPETKKISDLLHDFQTNKIHMAIVIDEYGGTSGLVTLEDILEEIIGEINDESDDAEKLAYTRIDEFNYLFEGKISLNDFCKALAIDEHAFDEIRGEADTLAGLILELTGEIPEKGKKINYHDFLFTIEEVDKRRITQIKATLPMLRE